MDRRELLGVAGFAVLGLAATRARAATGKDVIVCIFQRGGMDGLNVVAPVAEGRYHDLRPTLALPEPNGNNGVIGLDGFFALHPAAAPLEPFYRANQLAFVHATGATTADRSHFNAQALMERGIDTGATSYSGWLGRHLELSALGAHSLRGLSIADALDQALAGSSAAAAIPDASRFNVRSREGEAWLTQALLPFPPATRLGAVAHDTAGLARKLQIEKPFELEPENGAEYPGSGFGNLMRQAAQYIKADIGVEVICVNVGGWDHHTGEAAAMQQVLGDFARGVAAFATDLGARMANVTLVTMSEFGRRAQENASGTDHGRGNVMFAMGGSVNGGRVYGAWPGLAESALEEGDLAITTDYRTVLGEMLSRRAGNANLAATFPGFDVGAPLGVFR